jgi:hypothetical protein
MEQTKLHIVLLGIEPVCKPTSVNPPRALLLTEFRIEVPEETLLFLFYFFTDFND